jgi:RsiW-degrading membrane proteinase PrsW (M82 family)
MFLITFALLYMCFNTFSNINALPGMIFIGAITIPFSLIVFFVEVNAPRNISFFEVIKIFFMGGGASLLVALVLYSFISSTDGYFGAVLVGAVEEMAKLVVICFFISKIKNAKYLLNGLLIGAVVGAGFATFETAGYILNWGMNLGTDAMMHVLFLRAVLAPGGHVVWGAILGGAVILVKKERPFQMAQLLDTQFLSFAALCVAMHAVWDMPINIGGSWPVVQLGLTVAAWIVVLVLISVGLKQISRKVNNYQINQPENVEINA